MSYRERPSQVWIPKKANTAICERCRSKVFRTEENSQDGGLAFRQKLYRLGWKRMYTRKAP